MREPLVLFAPFALLLAAASARAEGGTSTTVTVDKNGEPTRFYGLALDWTMAMGGTLNPVHHASTFDHYLSPTWNLGKLWLRGTRFETLALALRFNFSVPITGWDPAYFQGDDFGYPPRCNRYDSSAASPVRDNPDHCPTDHGPNRVDYGDLWLSLRNPAIYTIPKAGITIDPGLRITLPVSAQSRFQTLRTSLLTSVALGRTLFGGKLVVSYAFGFNKLFHGSVAPLAPDGAPLAPGPIANGYDAALVESALRALDPSAIGTGGANNTEYSLTNSFSITVNPVERLSISALYVLVDAWAYPISCSPIRINGQLENVCDNNREVTGHAYERGYRDSQWWWVSIGYRPVDWLGLAVHWITVSPRRKGDDSPQQPFAFTGDTTSAVRPRQPFLSTNYDALTTISLSASISFEGAAARFWKK